MLKEQIIKNMERIVDECMGDSDPGCQATCPMHTDAKEYIRLIRDGKGEESIKKIREKLFIPGTLGRICAHPCEKNCKCAEIQSPMSIASLKRYAADNFDKKEDWDLTKKAPRGKKVAVIGAGPSGLQASLDLVREGFDVKVFEKLPVRGGMMAVGIPEYRLPRNVLENEISYLDMLGVEFEMNCEIGKDVKFEDLLAEYDSVIVACGKHQGRVDRSLEHWDAPGIFSAIGFAQEAALTRKVEGCGEKVLVVGGGDVSMDCCRIARRVSQGSKVYSICLEESLDAMPASEHEIKGAMAEGIEFNPGRAIKEIIVNDEGKIERVVLKKCLSMFDAEGRFAPSFDEDDTFELEVDTIVFAIGQGVDSAFAEGALAQKPNTNFECDRLTLQSPSNEKVFIAGDASGESVIVIQSMATGRRAAQSVTRYLSGESMTEGRSLEDTSSYTTKLQTNVDWSEVSARRMGMAELPADERVKNFDEVALGFTAEEAHEEASRCRQCVCKLCMSECMMMGEWGDCPKTIFKKYLEEGYENVDKMLAFSCNDCNQCTIKCPKDLNLRENFIAIKEQYVADNNNEQVIDALKPFDRTQEMECSKEYSTTVVPEKKKVKYLFAPGCTVPAYNPEGVEKTLEHLRDTLDGEVGCMLQCCGKVTKLTGENKNFERRNKMAIDEINATNCDVIITICPSCYKVFSETSDKPVISYWDLMKEQIGIPEHQKGIGKDSDVVFNIHDSCVTRYVTSHHESVRWVLDQLGYKWEEMHHNRENTRCCGVGGMVCNSNPALYEKIYTRRANDCTTDHVVTYCGSCRGTLEAAGKDTLHMLDLIHGDTYYGDFTGKRGYKDEDEMWARRLATKELIDQVDLDN